MSTEMQKIELTEPTPMALLQLALEQGADPDKLEKLMALQERYTQNELVKQKRAAVVAYNRAMSACQADMIPVQAEIDNQQTRSKYADYATIDKAIRPVYTRHGFSVSAVTKPSDREGFILLEVRVMHADGHTKTFSDYFPLDDAGIKGSRNKTAIQAGGSSTTYARRIMVSGIFNVAITRDDDGNSPRPTITDGQLATLQALLDRIHPDDDASGKLLAWAQVGQLQDLPADLFLTAKQTLEQKVKHYEN